MKDLRQRAGWSQGDLAQKLTDAGYSTHQTVISKVEAKARRLTLEDVYALAAVLDVPVSSLVTDGQEALQDAFLRDRIQRTADALADAQAAVSELQRAYPPVS